MQWMRILRHRTAINRGSKKLFDQATMTRLQQAIVHGETTHRAEVRLIVESAMPYRKLRRGMTTRQRALDLFGTLRVWDTADNNGVLLYINLADHAFEVIADREASRRIGSQHWLFACQLAQDLFRKGAYEQGVVAALDAMHRSLAAVFPADIRAHQSSGETMSAR